MRFWRSPHDEQSRFHLGKKNALLGAVGLSLTAFVLQLVGAWYTGSLALLGDTAHLMTDLFSLVMTLGALLLASRPTTEVRSFGFHRLEVLATFVNGLLLSGVSVALAVECVSRLRDPAPIHAGALLVVATIGLVFNLISGWLLHRASREDGIDFHHHGQTGHGAGCGHEHAHEHAHDGEREEMQRQEQHHADRNLQSALLHIWGDALNSVAVIVGAIVVKYTGSYQVDALVGLVIALLLLRWSWAVLKDSVHVLLEGTPRHVRPEELLQAMAGIDARVAKVEDLHVWEITSRMYAATAEIWVSEMSLDEAERLRLKLHTLLHDRFGIAHVVLAIRPD